MGDSRLLGGRHCDVWDLSRGKRICCLGELRFGGLTGAEFRRELVWRGGGEGEDEVGGEDEGGQGEENARGKIFCCCREEPSALALLVVLSRRLIGALEGTWRVLDFGPRRRPQLLLRVQAVSRR